jgi:hypothetical protein
MEGLAAELRPMKFTSPDGGVDKKIMEENFLARDVKPSQTLQHGYLYRNLNNPDAYYDENVQRMVMNYRAGFMRIANDALHVQNDKERGKQVMVRMEEAIPLNVIPMQDWRYTYYIARLFNELGDTTRFEFYAKNVEEKCLANINSGQIDLSDGSNNPYLILSEIYGLRKDYPRAIDMLNALASEYPNVPWIKSQITMYDKLQKGGAVTDSTRVQ